MKFALWTRYFWVVLVYVAFHPKATTQPQLFLSIWRGLATVTPCAKCRGNFKKKNLDPEHALRRGTPGLINLVLQLRNAIEASQGKALTTRKQIDAFYAETQGEVGAAFSGLLWAVASDWDARTTVQAPSFEDTRALVNFVRCLMQFWPHQDDAKRVRMVDAVDKAFWHTKYFGQVLDKDFAYLPGQTRVMRVLPVLQQFQQRFDLPPLPNVKNEDHMCTMEECGDLNTTPRLFRVQSWKPLLQRPMFYSMSAALLFTLLLLFVILLFVTVHRYFYSRQK